MTDSLCVDSRTFTNVHVLSEADRPVPIPRRLRGCWRVSGEVEVRAEVEDRQEVRTDYG